MFAGEFRCGVDDKGRFVLPSVFRAAFPVEDEQLAKSVIILKSLDHSLWLVSNLGMGREVDGVAPTSR